MVFAAGNHPRHSPGGIAWTTITAAVMFALAAGKAHTGAALDNPVLRTEGRVTLIDGGHGGIGRAGLQPRPWPAYPPSPSSSPSQSRRSSLPNSACCWAPARIGERF